jgi:hypothetical protein
LFFFVCFFWLAHARTHTTTHTQISSFPYESLHTYQHVMIHNKTTQCVCVYIYIYIHIIYIYYVHTSHRVHNSTLSSSIPKPPIVQGLTDWYLHVQASQQMQAYKSAFQLDTPSIIPSSPRAVSVSSRSQQELDAINKVSDSVLPKALVAKKSHSRRQDAAAMLKHYAAINNRVFPKDSGSKHNERENSQQELDRLQKLSASVWPAKKSTAHKDSTATAKQQLAHYRAINNRVFPKEKAQAKKAPMTAEQELAHFGAVSDATMPKTAGARKARRGQSAQAMLKHYAAINNRVFPKDAAPKRHVQDV